jgi:hypothetical protein
LEDTNFSPGFRISVVDVIVLLLGITASIGLGFVLPWLGAVIAFVVGHFFLFCNIVRMARSSELTWAAIFLTVSTSTVVVNFPGWFVSFFLSSLATFILVIVELRKPSYHGVFWQYFNPDLPYWWSAQAST